MSIAPFSWHVGTACQDDKVLQLLPIFQSGGFVVRQEERCQENREVLLQPGPGREGCAQRPEQAQRVLYSHGFPKICSPVCKESSWERWTGTSEPCVLNYHCPSNTSLLNTLLLPPICAVCWGIKHDLDQCNWANTKYRCLDHVPHWLWPFLLVNTLRVFWWFLLVLGWFYFLVCFGFFAFMNLWRTNLLYFYKLMNVSFGAVKCMDASNKLLYFFFPLFSKYHVKD